MPPTPNPSQWWVFFPFSHLSFHDKHDSLSKPLFGDVTLISAKMLFRVFEATFNNQHGDGKTYPDGQWFSSITKDETYLAVRRRGVVNTKWFMEDRKNEKFIDKARYRAAQISALFTVAFLATSPNGYLCGLSDQFRSERQRLIFLQIGQEPEGLVTESSGSFINTFTFRDYEDRDLLFSREELLTKLNQPRLRGLTQIMIAQKPTIAKSLYTTINQACVRLANAVLANSYTEQLLGAITCIELLLTDETHSTRYASIKRRLAALVGEDIFEKYDFKKALAARHSYVHRGEEVQARTRPLQVVSTAIYALLLYANVASQFKRKDSFLAYLDMLDLSERLEKFGDNRAENAVGNLIEQLRQENKLPIFELVDETIEFDREFNMGLYDRYDRVYVDEDEDADEGFYAEDGE